MLQNSVPVVAEASIVQIGTRTPTAVDASGDIAILGNTFVLEATLGMVVKKIEASIFDAAAPGAALGDFFVYDVGTGEVFANLMTGVGSGHYVSGEDFQPTGILIPVLDNTPRTLALGVRLAQPVSTALAWGTATLINYGQNPGVIRALGGGNPAGWIPTNQG